MLDLQPGEWKKVERWAEEELKKARAKNDALGLSLEETAAYRGEIRLLKRILDLPNTAARAQAAPLE